jgi:hypothetical protein
MPNIDDAKYRCHCHTTRVNTEAKSGRNTGDLREIPPERGAQPRRRQGESEQLSSGCVLSTWYNAQHINVTLYTSHVTHHTSRTSSLSTSACDVRYRSICNTSARAQREYDARQSNAYADTHNTPHTTHCTRTYHVSAAQCASHTDAQHHEPNHTHVTFSRTISPHTLASQRPWH